MYDRASPGYRGRCTAPLLLDKKTRRIISSESPEILATLFRLQLPGSTDFDLAPPHLEQEANQLKALVYNQASIRGILVIYCMACCTQDLPIVPQECYGTAWHSQCSGITFGTGLP